MPGFCSFYEVLLERHPSERGGWRWETALDAQRHGKSTALCAASIGGLGVNAEGVSSNTPWVEKKSWIDTAAALIKAKCFFQIPLTFGKEREILYLFHWKDMSKFLFNISLTIFCDNLQHISARLAVGMFLRCQLWHPDYETSLTWVF